MLRIPETLLALVIAAAFALIGDLLLGRRSRAIFSWAESFLIGGAVCATALFPLTLVSRRHALTLLMASMAAAVLGSLLLRLRGRLRTGDAGIEPGREGTALDGTSIAFFCLIVLSAGAFAALNWRYAFLWDGFQIWASRAQALYHQGGLAPFFVPGDYFNQKMNYPPLVPLYEALVCALRGGFDFEAVKPVFLFLYVAMALSTYRAAAAVSSRRTGLAATALVCLLPMVSTRWSAGGYADMPQSAYVAALAASFLAGGGARGWRSPTPWLIGSLSTVKSEGLTLSLLCCAVAILAAISRRREGEKRLADGLLGAAPAAILIELRWAYLQWINYPNKDFVSLTMLNLRRAADRLPEVLRQCGREIVRFSEWGFFWEAFLLAVLVLAFARPVRRDLRIVAGTTLAALLGYTAAFLFSSWPVALHVAQAYPRLLQQLAPAAAVVIAAACDRSEGLLGSA